MKLSKFSLIILFAVLLLSSCQKEADEPTSPNGNNPPNQPSNPSPANNATNVSLNPTLSWSCSDSESDSLTYDVYFGSASNPPLVSNGQSYTSYNPENLQINTFYYWKIKAIDEFDDYTISSVWHFTTTNTVLTWTKTFGGSDDDYGNSVQQTTDGGYIIAGSSGSKVCLIKTDSNGNQLWFKTYGGNGGNEGNDVQQTSDGGYIVTGEIYYSNVPKVYLFKTDVAGNELWYKTFGFNSGGRSVQQTSDGGYVIAGSNSSSTNLIRTDAAGNLLWSKTFDGTSSGYCVQQTSDWGYIITGTIYSSGNNNVYLLKTDASGNQQWYRSFGGYYNDNGYSVQQTTDGGYIITGCTEIAIGNSNVYLIKTDASGNQIWYPNFGGTHDDSGESVQQTTDGGYIITGYTGLGYGDIGVYLIKTDALGIQQWSKTFNENNVNRGKCVQQTSDGGYIITGWTIEGSANVYLIKTDSQGNVYP